jgi:hypothetical protein
VGTRKIAVALVAMATVLILLCIAGGARARSLADEPAVQSGARAVSAVSPLLQYQGRLSDPGTGDPVADDTYAMTFSLYDVDSGGSPLWTETKDVTVQGGLFSTALGDTTALDTGLFNGQALWLGITVGADAEATPRQQLLPVAYALSLAPGAQVIGEEDGQPTLALEHTGESNALRGIISSTNPSRSAIIGQNNGPGWGVAGLANSDEVAGVGGINDGTGPGVLGESAGGSGVLGSSLGTGPGVEGVSVDGYGGYFTSTNTYGLRAETASTAPGMSAVLGVAGGWASHDLPYPAGVLGKSASDFGVAGVSDDYIGTIGRSDTYYGVWGESHGTYAGVWGASWGGGYGVRAYSTDSHGVYAEGDTASGNYGGYFTGWGGVYGEGYLGVHGESSDDYGDAVRGHGTGSLTEGVVGMSDLGTGVYGYAVATSGSNAIGVWGQTNATWGFYTAEDLYVGGTCTGCTIAFIAQNEDGDSLEVGDVVSVSGIGPPLADQQTPVLKVRRAAGSDGGLLGVVQARAVVNAGKKLVSPEDTSKRAPTEIATAAPGDVAPGDHLFVVVQGLVQVRADASGGAIQVGDPLGATTGAGLAQKLSQSTAPDQVLGRALEALDKGSGLIWVLILGR